LTKRNLDMRIMIEAAQITVDVDALMAALQADASPRQSPIYKWLDACHDELLAKLGGQRVNWRAFAAYLKKVGLTDGKGREPTASVARNAWHRVKLSRSIGTAGADGAQQTDDEGSYQTSSASPSTIEVLAQDEDAAQSGLAPRGNDYPPGIRALAPESSRDSAPAAHNLPPATPDPAPLSESISWTAKFAAVPPAEIRDLLRSAGGKWDAKRGCWSGTEAQHPINLEAAVKEEGGVLQVWATSNVADHPD
jgi:hypothetical protein